MCVQPHHVHVVEHPSYDKDDTDMFVENSNAKDVDDDKSYETDFSDRKFFLKSWSCRYRIIASECVYSEVKLWFKDYIKKISFTEKHTLKNKMTKFQESFELGWYTKIRS